jgi:hypothetical protein
MSEIDELLKAADRAMATNNLDAAESIVDSLLMKVKQAAGEEDDSDYDDPSNPSADAAADDGDNGDDDEDDDDDDDGSMDKLLRKAWHERSTSGAPTRMRGQHVRVQTPETYRLSAEVQPQGTGKRHRFESRVDHIQHRDGISKHLAMSRARVEHPVAYTDYQDHLARRSTSQQHMVRGHNLIAKSAASTTYEDLVSEQIAKGCSPELAAQRVVNLHGYRALDTRMFTETAEDITKRFQREVEKIMYEDGCDATEATRLARIENPTLFKALQLV